MTWELVVQIIVIALAVTVCGVVLIDHWGQAKYGRPRS